MYLQNYLYLYCRALLLALHRETSHKAVLNGVKTIALVNHRWRCFFQSIGARAIVPTCIQLQWSPKKVLEYLEHLDTMLISSTVICNVLPIEVTFAAWECALALCLTEFECWGWNKGTEARCLVFYDGDGNHRVVHSIAPLECCTSLDGAPAMFSDGEVKYMESIGDYVKLAPSLETSHGFKNVHDIQVTSLRRDECPWATGVTWDLPKIDHLPETEVEWERVCEKVIQDWEEMDLVYPKQ